MNEDLQNDFEAIIADILRLTQAEDGDKLGQYIINMNRAILNLEGRMRNVEERLGVS